MQVSRLSSQSEEEAAAAGWGCREVVNRMVEVGVEEVMSRCMK